MNTCRLIFFLATMTTLLVNGVVAAQEEKKEPQKKVATKQEESKEDDAKPVGKQEKKVADSKQQETCMLANIEMKDICGKSIKLKKYQGKVVLIVNVASKCGYTGQYKPLQALHDKFNEQGLEIVAFPCNQFGKQEPAKEEAISKFCKNKFGIEFDMFAKVDVKGDNQVELFKQLTKCELEPAGKGAIRWNFEKFLIGKDGKPIARFRSNVSPNDEVIVSKIKSALGIEIVEEKEGAKSGEKERNDAKVKQDKKS